MIPQEDAMALSGWLAVALLMGEGGDARPRGEAGWPSPTSNEADAARAAARPRPVVLFVCEHGTVKSLLARLLFERAARKAGLEFEARSRGTAPDAAVPPWMKAALVEDGFDIGDWRPEALRESDVRTARHVVAFDVAVPYETVAGAFMDRWDGLPAVSKDYAARRDAIRARVEALVDRLATQRPAARRP